MQIKFKIKSLDGTEEEVLVRPSTLIAFETDGHQMGDDKPVTGLYTLAWYAMKKPGNDFLEWVDTLEEIESVEEEEAPAKKRPTRAGSPT